MLEHLKFVICIKQKKIIFILNYGQYYHLFHGENIIHIFYYSLFLYLSAVSISQIYNKNNIYLHITNITSFLIIIFTGLRDNVGGDWNVYIVLFEQFKQFGFPQYKYLRHLIQCT